MTPVRLAVIGTGHLGRIHARLSAGLAEIDLVAVVDTCQEAREGVAREVGTRATGDYRSLIGEIDAAVVATPTSQHHALVKDLLQAGVAVLVEKPITATLDQANDLVTLARRLNLVLQVGHVERFNPALSLVAGDVRDPRYIQATRTSGYTFRSTDIGVVLDLMIHDIDIVLSLTRSPVREVSAVGLSVLGGTEDLAQAQLKFESGCIAQLTASRVSFTRERSMQIFTSRAFASLDFATRQVTTVKPREDILRRQFRLGDLNPEERATYRDHLFESLLARSTRTAPEVNAIQEELQDFARAIREGRAPRVPGTAGRDALAVAEMVLQQIDAHEWDGQSTGRHGPFAMPALPLASDALRFPLPTDEPLRRAG